MARTLIRRKSYGSFKLSSQGRDGWSMKRTARQRKWFPLIRSRPCPEMIMMFGRWKLKSGTLLRSARANVLSSHKEQAFVTNVVIHLLVCREQRMVLTYPRIASQFAQSIARSRLQLHATLDVLGHVMTSEGQQGECRA